MTRFAAAALATLSTVLATGAHAQVTSCSAALSGGTIHRNLFVPDGATCSMDDVRVVGNVLVGANATLSVGSGTKIGGNILADGCNAVQVGATNIPFNPIFVGGNVEVHNCTLGSFQIPNESGPSFTIRGNLSCENNSADCVMQGGEVGGNVRFIANVGGSQIFGATIGGNVSVNDNPTATPGAEAAVLVNGTVGGNVDVSNNSGSGLIVGNNVIGGNLRCVNNSQGVTDDNVGPNTVNGRKLGQCSGL
jgi:hypothetical protein